jgi:hypothetical protein
MTKFIYIATNQHGAGVKVVSQFEGRIGFMLYADEVTAMHDVSIQASDSIDTICDKLYDSGPGIGARHHNRVSRIEAIALIKSGGVSNHTWLEN